MYDQYYQFHTLPFENTPDPRFFFASEQHREALAAIEYTIRMRKGFVLITGEIGSGKTTVGRTMCQRCGDTTTVVQVTHGHETGTGLIRQVIRALDLPVPRTDDRWRLLDRLRRHLVEQMRSNHPVVLFVDEAQTLSDDAMEELRLLSNFDTATQKPVQVVLVGQPELLKRLATPRMAPLRQRIVLAKHLQPMCLADTIQYIRHRLSAASLNADQVRVSFTDEAAGLIHRHSRGIPRLINVTCDNCLLLGYVHQVSQITPARVNKVLADMVPVIQTDDTDESALDNVQADAQTNVRQPRQLMGLESLRLTGSF